MQKWYVKQFNVKGENEERDTGLFWEEFYLASEVDAEIAALRIENERMRNGLEQLLNAAPIDDMYQRWELCVPVILKALGR